MAKKEQLWRGRNQDELKKIELKEFALLITARERRKINRGFTLMEKALIKNIEKNVTRLRTHCRDMVIIPLMIGKTIHVFNGKEFVQVLINHEMLGHRLGEFTLTRKGVKHSAPGVGATRSSAAISVK